MSKYSASNIKDDMKIADPLLVATSQQQHINPPRSVISSEAALISANVNAFCVFICFGMILPAIANNLNARGL